MCEIQITDLDTLNISCGFVESTKPVSCVEIARNNLISEQIILISYDDNLVEEKYIVLTYSNELCDVFEELIIAGEVLVYSFLTFSVEFYTINSELNNSKISASNEQGDNNVHSQQESLST